MRPKYCLRDPKKIGPKLLKSLSRLTLQDGVMFGDLTQRVIPKKRSNARVALCYLGPCLVGWGLVEINRWRDSHRMFADLGVFVYPSFRTHGLGRGLVKAMVKWTRTTTRAKAVVANPWNWASCLFFVRCGLVPDWKPVRAKMKLV